MASLRIDMETALLEETTVSYTAGICNEVFFHLLDS